MAATSALGKMIHKIAVQKGLKVINIVRNQENVLMLQKYHQITEGVLDFKD